MRIGTLNGTMPSMKGNPVSRSPRVQVTLSPEVMAVLEEISEITGQGKGTLVSELMTEALPAIKATLDALVKRFASR